MNRMGEMLVAIVTGLIGLAIVAVIVSQKANTSGVLNAAGGALSGVINAAVSPVSGGGGSGWGSSTAVPGF